MKQLVLVGGGHSHAIALKMYYDNPIKNVKITLINEVKKTPYSGMLPAHIAGYYNFHQTHINLEKLAQKTNSNLMVDQVIDINPTQQKVYCLSGNTIKYDLLSIDIGSTPDDSQIKGAKEYAIRAKPVPTLLEKWEAIINDLNNNPNQNITLNIIGGGAGGVELALNMHKRLTDIVTAKQVNINIINRGQVLLNSHNIRASKLFNNLLEKKDINIILETEIVEICSDKVITKKGNIIKGDYTFLVTNASPASWLKNTGLSIDKKGFILVKNTLQTLSHDNIFATGDIATIKDNPSPKAGVFAVRQGKPLYNNWRLLLEGKSLNSYYPQSFYLSLIGTGDKKAVAIWGNCAYLSKVFWYLKDYIDKKFMEQFSS
ncbi:selenophosphate synthase SelD [Cyanobacterium sp. HL-69]|uniref:FAD-dependent oxidoreductase n=1 Tax=Cyanobacterium sp. HL-69 TaxID=2054282 RepID=UPI000CA3F04F|nr:selenophosphate synthase SelD [Cyanobacterium sp. HL-69]